MKDNLRSRCWRGCLAGLALLALSNIPLPAQAQTGVRCDGANDYITFGQALSLGTPRFTLELWFYREGTGATTTTGTGGVTAIPLLTKGRGEAEASNVDMNYFLGIRGSDNVLCADYEEGAGQTSPGLNHPIAGVTAIRNNTWYHAAATFDGTTWRLYLNGLLEGELAVGANRLPRSDSIQHAGLASAMTSTGLAAGFFQGVVDEARIWNRARTQAAIADSMLLELGAGPGLLGRWGLNDGSGTTAANSVGGAPAGTLTNGPTWATGSPFSLYSLQFGSANAYATFGSNAALGLSQFTIETWFRRDGAGVQTTTGTGGITNAVPILTKGRGEAEASNVDMNWFLGLRGSDYVLAADFEEGAAGTSPGLNHPIVGVTPIGTGAWHHAAATYDGTTWHLYLDGFEEGNLAVGQPPRSDSIQHAGLGTALNSTGVAAGFFNGAVDEARVWNYARTEAEIRQTINAQLTGARPGLVARWSVDESGGSTIRSTAGTAVNGTITGSGWSWAAAAPFNLTFNPPEPPAAPSGLTATANGVFQIGLGWADNSSNELNFEIERSTAGSGGPWAPKATVGAGVTAWSDTGLDAGSDYCYRVRATNAVGSSDWASPACATTPAETPLSLDLGSGGAYVSFGNPPALGLAQFTIETWLRRDGTGTAISTGTNGVTAVPVVTHGTAEQDGSNVDMNWFVGIRSSDNVLCADFEEGAAGSSPGNNHPIAGSIPIATGVWHHAAATYDGNTWRLYLDGQPDGVVTAGQPPRSDTIQPAALGSSLKSTGATNGFFDGALDEARVWNYARTAEQIKADINRQITTPEPGLIARWALNEASGAFVYGSAGTALTGTILGSGFGWTGPAPFNLSGPPDQPVLVAPPDLATGAPLSPALDVTVSDPEADALSVTFYGRPVTTAAGDDFSLVILPDTQYYSASYPATYAAQTQWIVNNRVARNIAFVNHVGDVVDTGDNATQWQNAWAALSLLEDPVTTGLPGGIPYSVTVGNHDQVPNGDAAGATTYYNQYLGVSHFDGRAYYGGHYGANSDNHVCLFSGGGMNFVLVTMEYDTAPDAPVLAWADSVLAANASRRAIVSVHDLTGTGNPASFATQGQAVYDALKDNANLFLMLCGHSTGEGRRVDTWNGHVVNTLEADYQGRANGGDGWLRILRFSPAANAIHVKTYSPTLDQFEADADSSSQFTLANAFPSEPWQVIGTLTGVASGAHAQMAWPDRAALSQYEWRVEVSDGRTTTSGPTWRFTTGAAAPTVQVTAPNGGERLDTGTSANLQWAASGGEGGVASVDLLLSRTGSGGPFSPLAAGIANSGSWSWPVVGPLTQDAWLKVIAHDGGGHATEDVSDAAFTIMAPTSVPDGTITEFALKVISGNPLGGIGSLQLALPREARVRVAVFDVRGRLVTTLADGTYPMGRHLLRWDGRSDSGQAAAGVYFLRLEAPGKRLTQKIALVR